MMVLFSTFLWVFINGIRSAIIPQGEGKFNQQWTTGVWDYQDQVPAERLRNAAIGAVLVRKYAPVSSNCTAAEICRVHILEVGCGEGAVTDFLTPEQKHGYEGFDISEKAIQIAKKKRGNHTHSAGGGDISGNGLHFFHANVHHVHLKRTYDVIICSEVLYYTEHESMIDKFTRALSPHGIVIISLHMPIGKPLTFDSIFQYAERQLHLVDVVEVGGRKHPPSADMTMFRIKVFRNRHIHNTTATATPITTNTTTGTTTVHQPGNGNSSTSANNVTTTIITPVHV